MFLPILKCIYRKVHLLLFWRNLKGKNYAKIQLLMLMFHTLLGHFCFCLVSVLQEQRMSVTVIQGEITSRDNSFWIHSSRKWAWLFFFFDRKRHTEPIIYNTSSKKRPLECVEHHKSIISNHVKVSESDFSFKMRPFLRNLSATVHFVSLISFSSSCLAVLHCASGSYRWAASEHLTCY